MPHGSVTSHPPRCRHVRAGAGRARPRTAVPREDRLFRLLNLLVWGAFGLTTLFLFCAFRGSTQDARRSGSRGALRSSTSSSSVFFLNWRLVKKLWRQPGCGTTCALVQAPSDGSVQRPAAPTPDRQSRDLRIEPARLRRRISGSGRPSLELFPDRNFNPPVHLYAVATMFG